jgi:hypothetical protein
MFPEKRGRKGTRKREWGESEKEESVNMCAQARERARESRA